jgi:hypothetical protein
MSKADSDSIRKPIPVTVTVAEITSLCDRLAARAKSVLLADQPEQVRDLDLAESRAPDGARLGRMPKASLCNIDQSSMKIRYMMPIEIRTSARAFLFLAIDLQGNWGCGH